MTAGSSLLRAVSVSLDRASWRSQPAQFRHPFPSALRQHQGPFPMHLLAMLLRLGDLTTPVLNVQSGVAKLWPLLRYLHAVADTAGFRFRSAWKDIDGHQKGVASDDLGVGLGMSVLYAAFNYTACVDGRAFLHRVSQLGLLALTNGLPPKVGSMKMADYAALDTSGRFHLIECKGSQHSPGALAAAMKEGRLQKQSLVCSSPGAERRLIGQRLVVGTHIVLENALRDTTVFVTDPAPLAEDPPRLAPRVSAIALAEPAIRLEFARALGSAGAILSARAMAQSDLPAETPALEGAVQRGRAQAALDADEPQLEAFEDHGESWLGERIIAPLLEPLPLGGRVYRFARITKGVSTELVRELRERAAPSPFFQEQYPEAANRLGREKVVTGENQAAIVRSGVSLSAIELLQTRRG